MHIEVETNRRKIRQRLEREGWVLVRTNGPHDIFENAETHQTIPLPRRRSLTSGTARSIAKRAGWV